MGALRWHCVHKEPTAPLSSPLLQDVADYKSKGKFDGAKSAAAKAAAATRKKVEEEEDDDEEDEEEDDEEEDDE